jgi:hypothetical protein
MSFRCTACSDKSYDKAWKLQRHINESSKCFEHFNPGTSATRFRCSICEYTSPREEDLKRHRRRIHPDIAITTARGTEEADQPEPGAYNAAPCLPPVTLLDTDEHPNQMERFNPHQDLKSSTTRPRYTAMMQGAVIACQICGTNITAEWYRDKQGNAICRYCGKYVSTRWGVKVTNATSQICFTNLGIAAVPVGIAIARTLRTCSMTIKAALVQPRRQKTTVVRSHQTPTVQNQHHSSATNLHPTTTANQIVIGRPVIANDLFPPPPQAKKETMLLDHMHMRRT